MFYVFYVWIFNKNATNDRINHTTQSFSSEIVLDSISDAATYVENKLMMYGYL